MRFLHTSRLLLRLRASGNVFVCATPDTAPGSISGAPSSSQNGGAPPPPAIRPPIAAVFRGHVTAADQSRRGFQIGGRRTAGPTCCHVRRARATATSPPFGSPPVFTFRCPFFDPAPDFASGIDLSNFKYVCMCVSNDAGKCYDDCQTPPLEFDVRSCAGRIVVVAFLEARIFPRILLFVD